MHEERVVENLRGFWLRLPNHMPPTFSLGYEHLVYIFRRLSHVTLRFTFVSLSTLLIFVTLDRAESHQLGCEGLWKGRCTVPLRVEWFLPC